MDKVKLKNKVISFSMVMLCFVLLFTACQTDQDALYSEAISQIEAEATAEPSIDPNDPGYLGLGTPAPEDRATPIPGDDLSGELTIQGYSVYFAPLSPRKR